MYFQLQLAREEVSYFFCSALGVTIEGKVPKAGELRSAFTVTAMLVKSESHKLVPIDKSSSISHAYHGYHSFFQMRLRSTDTSEKGPFIRLVASSSTTCPPSYASSCAS